MLVPAAGWPADRRDPHEGALVPLHVGANREGEITFHSAGCTWWTRPANEERTNTNMTINEVDRQPWSRKHDVPFIPVVASAPRTLYPQTLADLIDICSRRAPGERIHAAGSHWALSEAAISDS